MCVCVCVCVLLLLLLFVFDHGECDVYMCKPLLLLLADYRSRCVALVDLAFIVSAFHSVFHSSFLAACPTVLSETCESGCLTCTLP